MSRIPFDIKWKPQIESGEYKVETGDGKPVRIISWDKSGFECKEIVALVACATGTENCNIYATDGRLRSNPYQKNMKLFIVTPQEEPSEFEKKLWEVLKSEGSPIGPLEKFTDDDKRVFHAYSRQLLTLAREQFIKDGYVIEKKAFHDAVEKVSPEEMKEVSENVIISSFIADLGKRYPEVSFAKLARIAKAAYDFGKAEALKDLPRWKRIRDNGCVDADGDTYTDCLCLLKRGWYQVMSSGTKVGGELRYLSIRDLEKLPGFKEE